MIFDYTWIYLMLLRILLLLIHMKISPGEETSEEQDDFPTLRLWKTDRTMDTVLKNALVLYILVTCTQTAIVLNNGAIDDAWDQYKIQFDRNYDETEDMKRRQAFLDSLKYVIVQNLEHDREGGWYEAGLNCQSDIPADEPPCFLSDTHENDDDDKLRYKKRNTIGTKTTNTLPLNNHLPNKGIGGNCFVRPHQPCPPQIYWVDLKRVYDVGCQNCYAWATTYGLSSALAIKQNLPPLDLSVQEAKDCSYNVISFNNSFNNEGCKGGNPYVVYYGLMKNTKSTMTMNNTYLPYDTNTGRLHCDVGRAMAGKEVTIVKPYYKPNLSDCELEKQLVKGPVVTSMCSYDHVEGWKTHNKTAIYYNPNCVPDCQKKRNITATANHVVLLVGYTPDSWIIQNSWGSNSGYKGTAHFARGNSGGPHTCGIGQEIWWATVQ